ncbi:MAG: ABC transporter permease [Cytophagales bacterium]|nr:ABC transporter permease [Cytophagales bacterium]
MKPQKTIPPKLADQFLSWFCKGELLEEIQGDLHEYFEELQGKPKWKRNLFYWFHVFNFLRPFAIKKSRSNSSNFSIMFQHTLLISFRSFKRYKGSFLINLIGLSTGLACALLIYLWVNDELSVDKFHENDSRLFQAMLNHDYTHGITTSPATPGLLAETLVEEIPEVKHAVATTTGQNIHHSILSATGKNIKAVSRFAGKDYFNMFSYNLIQGDRSRVLSDKNAVVLSETLAIKLFNTTENVLGKEVELNHKERYTVSGVVEDIRSSSSDQFDFVLSVEVLKDRFPGFSQWGNTGLRTFVMLNEGANLNDLNMKIGSFIKSKHESSNATLFLRPYSDRYLYNKYENGRLVGGRIEYVKLFSIIAIFILIIACINFMNLSTARSLRQMKEVGIKKAIGANRKVLAFQYLGESMLMTFLSLGVSLIIVWLFLPHFNQITSKELILTFDLTFIICVALITILTGLIAGSYPALYLSGFNPVSVLKGKLSTSAREFGIRRALVVFQFMLTILLIVGVMVVYKQMEYLQSKNLGYDRDNVIMFKKEGEVEKHLETFLSEVKNIPGVVDASSTTHRLTGHQSRTSGLQWDGKTPDDFVPFEIVHVNYRLIETLEIEIIAGRAFSKEFASDESGIIFNEVAIKRMGLHDPIGESVKLRGEDRQIIGVTKDFHFQSFYEDVNPLFLLFNPGNTDKVVVKIEAGRERETIGRLQQFYQEYNPGFPLDYAFLDQGYQAQYVAEQRVASLSRYFSGLAIIITCLGLFGVMAFTAKRRTKEIGIRKILGSSAWGIIRLLSVDFAQMVLVAIVIAMPLSYIIVKNWLDDFAYRIDLAWWFFVGAGVIALFIALFTITLQTIKAANVNPVQCLRDE